jgi:hypothetical protein
MPGCGHGDPGFVRAVRRLGNHFGCRGPRVHVERDVTGSLGGHHVGSRGSGGRHDRLQCGGQRRPGFAPGGGCRKRSPGGRAAGAGALPLRGGAYRRGARGRRRAEHRGQDASGVCLDGGERSAVGQCAAGIGAWPGDRAGHGGTEPGRSATDHGARGRGTGQHDAAFVRVRARPAGASAKSGTGSRAGSDARARTRACAGAGARARPGAATGARAAAGPRARTAAGPRAASADTTATPCARAGEVDLPVRQDSVGVRILSDSRFRAEGLRGPHVFGHRIQTRGMQGHPQAFRGRGPGHPDVGRNGDRREGDDEG